MIEELEKKVMEEGIVNKETVEDKKPPEPPAKVILTEEQKAKILKAWEANPDSPPSTNDLTVVAFGKEMEARTREGRAIREFLATLGIKSQGKTIYKKKPEIELTVEQKEFISNHASNMKPLEMARELFDNNELTNLDLETRSIYEYLKTLPNQVKAGAGGLDDDIYQDYEPPNTIDRCVTRIQKYVNNSGINRDKLTEKQKRDVTALIGYLHTYRFLSQIRTYQTARDRNLFESEFIRCAFDKELNAEEVDQYIIYATEVVMGMQISARWADLERRQDESLEGENGRINMALVEAVKSLRAEYNQCAVRQKQLLKALQGERKERLKNSGANKENLLDLIMFWQNEEKRSHLLKLKQIRDEKLKDEIKRLETMDAVKAEIYGVRPEEILD
jgi:hypothetical protein